MPNKMLIDASHPEETRVVVLRGNKVEEFDFESANKRPLRGNIYLAKVMRVEPSLQAAFVDYGGNRHGFLAFSEIHPDYYQIPVADRQALIAEEARADAEEDEERPQGQRRSRRSRNERNERGGGRERAEKRQASGDETISEEATSPAYEGAEHPQQETHAHETHAPRDDGDLHAPAHQADEQQHDGQDHAASQHGTGHGGHDGAHAHDAETREPGAHEHDQPAVTAIGGGAEGEEVLVPAGARHEGRAKDEDGEESEPVEQMGGDAMEEMPRRASRHRRSYKIQEVIKRRQVLLIQVVKEERGNKGAALTTYLSLAGRYSVLMPNTAQGGGISRKITNNVDRKRLKEIAQELEVPDGMGIILRTAGAARTKGEVKRDFEYLLRMWEQVRELTLKSSAPMLTYEEGSLIKRVIRDLYGKEIDEVVVAGDAGFREAKDFMRMLMPSHAKNVQLYKDPQPIFARSGVEAQLDAMFSNQVTLKSGGYIVINQTEALVAIDVNSGRATREHNIEDTALRTNMEAADEVARQLRLRDLAGLIVVDFIDMEEGRNNRAVERRIKDALKNDRARIQIGRISHFGLLEMSRQRIRTGVLEGSTVQCPHCLGAGHVRSTASVALHVLRVIEDALIRSNAHNLNVRARSVVALYILNQKRAHLRELERRFGVTINIGADDTLTGLAYHAIDRGEPAVPSEDARSAEAERLAAPPPEPEPEDEIFEEEADDGEVFGSAGAEAEESNVREARSERGPREARSEKGGRHGGERGSGERTAGDTNAEQGEGEGESEDGRRKRRRRRRRGGRDERDASGISATAAQPSDDGLETMARVEGDFAGDLRPNVQDGAGDAPTGGGEAPPDGVREGRERDGPRRSRRGRGRDRFGRDRGPRNDEGGERAGEPPLEEAAAPRAGSWTQVESAQAAAPVRTPEPVMSQAEPAAEARVSAAEARERETPLSTEVDPDAPKRSGWWSRAKASFGG